MTAVARKVPDDDLFEPVDSAKLAAVESMEEWIGKKKAKRSAGIPESRAVVAREEVERMMSSADWSEATPLHFVAAFEVLFRKVYGVAPTLTSKGRSSAASAANYLLKDRFEGDTSAMAEFMRWTWSRESDREKYRRENKRPGGVLNWHLQFRGAIYDEWLIAKMRDRR